MYYYPYLEKKQCPIKDYVVETTILSKQVEVGKICYIRSSK